MNNDLVIRKASPEDAPVIFSLIKELAEYENLLDQLKVTVHDLEKILHEKNSFVEILIADYKITSVGYALFFHNFSTFLGKPGLYLEDLFVKSDFRGIGIGKALLEKIILLAKERDCGRVEWSVLDWNEPAIEFYKNRGAYPLKDWTLFRLPADKF